MQQLIKDGIFHEDATKIKETPHISYTDSYLHIEENSIASMHASMKAYLGVERTRISMYLQRQEGEVWTMITHWSQDFLGIYGSIRKDYEVDDTYKHRILVYYYAYKADDSNYLSMIIDDHGNDN
ncbi:MAG: hypothetical protein KAQ68_08425 [Clostridiales bacterium]|nr:hypothetical protein [Clostridiales bacterium]